jgi:hypothetical protein
MWAQQNNLQNETFPYMNTLTNCVNKVVKDGFADSFKVTTRGLYSCSKSRYYRPEQVNVVESFRFDRHADPNENAIMYVIETTDGIKGTLIDAYGAYADANVNLFMKEVEDIHKKIERLDRPIC